MFKISILKTTERLGMVAQACNLGFLGGGDHSSMPAQAKGSRLSSQPMPGYGGAACHAHLQRGTNRRVMVHTCQGIKRHYLRK
jgi:hypothetical protein